MACKDCNKEKFDTNNPCKVCELVENDTTLKRCKWCGDCKAYICERHWGDAFARIQAAIKTVVQKVTRKRKAKSNDITEAAA
jgi:hypothetical protein